MDHGPGDMQPKKNHGQSNKKVSIFPQPQYILRFNSSSIEGNFTKIIDFFFIYRNIGNFFGVEIFSLIFLGPSQFWENDNAWKLHSDKSKLLKNVSFKIDKIGEIVIHKRQKKYCKQLANYQEM